MDDNQNSSKNTEGGKQKQEEKLRSSVLQQQASSSSSGQTNSSAGTGTTVSSADTVPTQETCAVPEEVLEDNSWGSLYPIDRCFYPMELIDDEYVFGRGQDCSYCFDVPSIKQTKHFKSYSKKHFVIKRTPGTSGAHTVMLTDTSMNGVFINGERLPERGSRQLRDKDEIAISMDQNKILLFIDKTQEDDPNLPQHFREKYIMHKKIGHGAFGEVREALTKFGVGRYAVKIISKVKTVFNCSDKTEIDQNVMKEARLMLALHHPCVITVHDVFDSPQNFYIVLELACGGELFSRLVNFGAFREPVSKLIFYQMASAVSYLHMNNVTHRDLKPENILMMSDDEECLIKITDFGVSRLIGEASFMKTQAGTPSYLAPELLKTMRGSKQGYTKQVDSWSIGVVLYMCLVGYPPFARDRTDTDEDLPQQILHCNYNFNHKRWSNVSEDAKDLVRALLKMDDKERLTPKQALDDKWLQDDVMKAKARSLMAQTVVSTPSANRSLISRIDGQEKEKSAFLNVIMQQGDDSESSIKSPVKSGEKRAEKRPLPFDTSSESDKSNGDTGPPRNSAAPATSDAKVPKLQKSSENEEQ